MSTIWFNNHDNLQYHFALRKMETGLASVVIGLAFIGIPPALTRRVKAATVKRSVSVSKTQVNPHQQAMVKFGQIIPVDQLHRTIDKVQRPTYWRDPRHPAHALPTPAPKVDGYRPARRGQVANYDKQEQVVYPPADPRLDTFLLYEQTPAASEKSTGQRQANSSKNQLQVKESVQKKTRLFGFGKKKNKNKQQKPSLRDRLFKSGSSSTAKQTRTEQTAKTDQSQTNEQDQTTAANSQSTPIRHPADANVVTQRAIAHHSHQLVNSVTPVRQVTENQRLEQKRADAKKEQESLAKERKDVGTKKEQAAAGKQQEATRIKKARQAPSPSNQPKVEKKRPRLQKKQTVPVQAIMNPETKVPKKPFQATLKVLDQDEKDKVLTTLTCKGAEGAPIHFQNLLQVLQIYHYNGYQLKEATNLTTNQSLAVKDGRQIDFGSFGKSNLDFEIVLVHRLVRASFAEPVKGLNEKQVRLGVSLTVHYTGAGQATPQDKVQKASWTRDRTMDLVTHQLVKGCFDSNWRATTAFYQPVKTPTIKGYTADQAEIKALPVTMRPLTRTVTYTAAAAQVNKPKTDQKQTGAAFLAVNVDHPNLKVPRQQYEKTVTMTVNFAGAGQSTPKKIVQKVKWTRTLTVDQNGQVVPNGKFDTEWQPSQQKYQAVSVPVVAGYHAEQKQIKEQEVTQENLNLTVNYAKNGSFIPVDRQGQIIAPKQVYVTDPNDPTKLQDKQAVPAVAGYTFRFHQLTPPDIAQDLYLTYTKKVQFKRVDQAHPDKRVDASSYQRQTTLTVRFEGAGTQTPHPQSQTIHWQRSLTLNNAGKLVPDGQFTTAWQANVKTYTPVTVPLVEGFHADRAEISGSVQDKNLVVTVTYHHNGSLIPVDENDHVIGDAQLFQTDPKNPTKVLANETAPVIEGYKAAKKNFTPLNASKDQKLAYRKLKHYAVVNVDHPNAAIKPDLYTKEVTWIVTFKGAGSATPTLQKQTSKWQRSITVDEDNKVIANGQFDRPWHPVPARYKDVQVPVVKSYVATQAKLLGPKVEQQNLKTTVNYQANGALIPVDENGKQISRPIPYVTSASDPTKVETIKQLPEVKGYQPPKLTKPIVPQKATENQKVTYHRVLKAVNVAHPNDLIDPHSYERKVHFIVKFVGAGNKTPKERVQTVKWERTITVDGQNQIINNGQLTTNWQPDKNSYENVQVPVVTGFHTAEKIIIAPKVSEQDVTKTIKYQENGHFVPTNASDKAIASGVSFVTDPNDPTRILPNQKVPEVQGYHAVVDRLTPPTKDKNVFLTYVKAKKDEQSEESNTAANTQVEKTPKPETPQARPAEKSTLQTAQRPGKHGRLEAYRSNTQVVIVQTIHFIDDAGHEIHRPVQDEIIFNKQVSGRWDKQIATFATVTVPVIKGYFADRKAVEGNAVMPEDKDLKPQITVTYHRFGKIIPVSLEGKMIPDPHDKEKMFTRNFVNDKHDASQALSEQAVPAILGWTATVGTVSPEDPGVNIPVVYRPDK